MGPENHKKSIFNRCRQGISVVGKINWSIHMARLNTIQGSSKIAEKSMEPHPSHLLHQVKLNGIFLSKH